MPIERFVQEGDTVDSFKVVEICAGAGGQALGLEQAGFEHELAVELDSNACATLRYNRSNWKVAEGDVADPAVWKPSDYEGVSLLAGGVPCPPFTIAGKQLGATDERDLFAWAVELTASVRPRALLLENVRGLSMPRFAGYRQHVLDRLAELGYVAEWRLLHASDYGVPQLRPRFVLVALQPDDAAYFRWPEVTSDAPTVGTALLPFMRADGWEGAIAWAKRANAIAPTIVGGSKKHGGADLGPTRAKRAWAELGVNGWGIADAPPQRGAQFDVGPKLTLEMVARLQGWMPGDWEFIGRKTATYRQIGNAFPPPVAAALGRAIMSAFLREGEKAERSTLVHDPVYTALRARSDEFLTYEQIADAAGIKLDRPEFERRIHLLGRDFEIRTLMNPASEDAAYRLGQFRAFTGQADHSRHDRFLKNRARIS